TPDEVTFHEVGAWDSIIDIVGAAHLIDTLKADRWSISALPSGSGRVPSAHGMLPIPAPATVLLLEGFPVFDDGIAGERVTPTGAAIVRYLVRDVSGRAEASTLMRSGAGFGTRIMPGVSNILRVIAFESAASELNEELLAVIEFEIDDQTSEDLAIALERLRELPGIRDVLQIAACGKKGRIVSSIRILADSGAMADVTNACFMETTTLGIRTSSSRRISLERSSATADVGGQAIGVKLARRPDGSVTAKAEADDLQHAGDRRTRETLKTQAEQLALQQERTDGNTDADG
ncbi:MAG TPA: LarC family nickel insertion protein, partial [Burkholderiales bacterium]|nr:LarC family nickel insertion protein [Burkholderiales bacterium]